jgi:hypothetical protein
MNLAKSARFNLAFQDYLSKKIKKIFLFSVFLTLGSLLLFGINKAFAAGGQKTSEQSEVVSDKKILIKQGDWTALSAFVDDKKMCYAINYSKVKIGNQNRSKDSEKLYYLDIDYLGEDIYRVSVNFGQSLAKYSNVFISLDGLQYELDTFDNIAFFTDYNEDKRFVEDLKKSSKILVRATYNDNSYSVDEFAGFGFVKTNDTMHKVCDR